jgi:hypothetical protein
MRPFLYPSMDWAYGKIEGRLKTMGQRADQVVEKKSVHRDDDID